jgi:hypothetical protein
MSDASVGGADTLRGGDGAFENYLNGDGSFMTNAAKGGDDTLRGGDDAEYNELVGDSFWMSDNAAGGSDVLRGGDGATFNALYGDANGMLGNAVGGNDNLRGGDASGLNRLYGDSQIAANAAGERVVAGNDVIRGGDNISSDNVFGFGNFLYGDFEQVSAGATVSFGNDRLISGSFADDIMFGDAEFNSQIGPGGADTFVFGANNGADYIMDFEVGNDQIELNGIAGIDDFGDLRLTFIGSDTLIDLGDGNSVIVFGVTDLSASDFIFGP